ncbi:ATP-binding protein [Parasphingorhabdus sp.]|uniref:ATP-binding protein n=1 Tax=Parasphingorhabdus sp. TaxID=2709688 RepID=UPI003594228A
MRIRPTSLKWQTIVILVGTLLLSHIIALLVYAADRSETLATADTLDLTERIAGYVELAAGRTGDRRRSVLETANSRFLKVETGKRFGHVECESTPIQAEIDATLRASTPDGLVWSACILPVHQSSLTQVTANVLDDDYSQILLIDFGFPDGGTVRFEGALNDGRSFLADSAALYILLSVIMVGIAAYFLMERATRPLKLFATQASQIGRELHAPPLDEGGPDDVRVAAKAFNQMQFQLQRLISGRTQMLAAISHDLRTPLARLRLRVEFLEDATEREMLLRTLDEMEAMVLSVLQFLRGSTPTEDARDVDLAALVDSVCLDMAATGLPVIFDGQSAQLRLRCRPATLRRAIENLIDNAVRYGRVAHVSVVNDGDIARIDIRDEGPGVPEDQMEEIMQPFIRGDESRSRGAGGHGLGLSTALTIVHAHGGNLLLENRATGGLKASILIPI